MRSFKGLSLGLLLIFAAAIPASAQENSFKRIVSFNPVLTESIYLLGAEDRLVANTIYCTQPEAAKDKPKIGTLSDMNVEKVLSLQPDLVLATTLTPQRVKKRLSYFGVRVETFNPPKNFDELCQQFVKLGKILGKERQARQIVDRVRVEVFKLKKEVNSGSPKVFVQIGTNPLFTVQRDSFINDLIEFAGGINIARDARGGMYSREEVLRRNPDVIIIASMGMVGQEERRTWKNYSSLNAAKHNRVYVVDPDMVCSPTPFTFKETLKDFISLLYQSNE